MITLTGYKVKTKSLSDIQMILDEMRNRMLAVALKEYHRLLSREAEWIVDRYCTGAIQRPAEPILTVANNILLTRLNYAGLRQNETEYNLLASASVMLHDTETVITLNSENLIYLKKVDPIKGLIPIHIDDEKNGEEMEKRAAIWDELREMHPNGGVLRYPLITMDDFRMDTEKLKFATPQERAKRIVVNNTMNRLISDYACGRQIEPYELMDYVSISSSRLETQEDMQKRIERQISELLPALPNITVSMLESLPDEAAQSRTFSEPSQGREEEEREEETEEEKEEGKERQEQQGHVEKGRAE